MKRILFLCASNDSLSLMAEALLRHIDSRNFEAYSASVTGERAHPFSIEAMKEIGIELGERASVEESTARSFDLVIVLGELSGRENYSAIGTETIHWKFENPLTISDNPQVQRRVFRSVRDQIAQRIRLLAIVHARADRVVVTSSPSQTYSSPVI